jgi:hypothetical protein
MRSKKVRKRLRGLLAIIATAVAFFNGVTGQNVLSLVDLNPFSSQPAVVHVLEKSCLPHNRRYDRLDAKQVRVLSVDGG